jgi:hypothetical protein
MAVTEVCAKLSASGPLRRKFGSLRSVSSSALRDRGRQHG